jgi:arsenate reductase-like glutaredoxin family protein
MKAREFLAHKTGREVPMRNLVKQPLDAGELRRLADRVGGARNLVAPKRKAEADAVPDGELVEWLAADGGRVRRPIIIAGRKTALGFTASSRAEIENDL